MRPSIRSRLIALVRAQWAGLLALFLVIAGGTAYAAATIGSAEVIDNSLASVDIKNNQLRSADVKNESLTGADIADQSGVDNCTHGTARFGELCVGVANQHNDWLSAGLLCANLGLRLPSFGEAWSLVRNYDLPNVDENELFWTEEETDSGTAADGVNNAYVVSDDGLATVVASNSTFGETVCVTTPTN